MGFLNIDTSNPDLLKKRTFDPIPSAKYVCEVANQLKVEAAKDSKNSIVKIELRVIDDGEYKGRILFDNLVIAADPATKAKTEWKIAQFAVATGCYTKDNLDQIDLDVFQGSTVEVMVGVKVEEYQGEKRSKNVIKQYIFEDEEATA